MSKRDTPECAGVSTYAPDAYPPVRATYDASTDPVPALYVMEYGKPGRLATAEERAEYDRVTAPCKDEPPRSPAAMLGEALALIQRAQDLARSSGVFVTSARTWDALLADIMDAKREADAKESKP